MKTAAAALVVLALAAPAVAAEPAASSRQPSCVRVDLLDQDDLPVKGQPPVVALLVAGKPILPEANYPSHFTVRPGMPAPCPAALVESVAQNYKGACLTVERRTATAAQNNVTAESVVKQCQTIREALGDSLTPYLK